MEFFFARTVKPCNTIPPNVRSINCNDKEIPHLRSWMIKHYNQQTESYFDVNNLCTWVSFCRCPSCRPVWVQSNNIVSLLPFLLTFHISYPIIILFYLPSCVKLWIFFTSFLYSISLTSSYYFLGDVGSSCDMSIWSGPWLSADLLTHFRNCAVLTHLLLDKMAAIHRPHFRMHFH